jgi:hypothetical protein
VGNVVFARRAVRSDASRGHVDKLSFSFTGPWGVVASLSGASYEIELFYKDKGQAARVRPFAISD